MTSVFTSRKKRVDATLEFLTDRIPAALHTQLTQAVSLEAHKKNAGAYIRLDLGRDSDARRALRSILLCQYLLVDSRSDGKVTAWGKASFGTKASTKDHWKNRPEIDIIAGVKAYDKSGTVNLADTLDSLGTDPGDIVFAYNKMTRETTNLGAREPICYQSIAFALWLSGRASLPWLSTWYASLNAGNCFQQLGPGDEIQLDQIARILNLRGAVISFRAREIKGPQTVNHWAVITGEGKAVGSNTDGFNDAGSAEPGYQFIWGKRRFGKFDIQECIDACNANTKYSDSGGVRVAIHPFEAMDLW
ncbi:MAG: hypothetical protein ACFB03_05950 [Paracoccaceae bacterium]